MLQLWVLIMLKGKYMGHERHSQSVDLNLPAGVTMHCNAFANGRPEPTTHMRLQCVTTDNDLNGT